MKRTCLWNRFGVGKQALAMARISIVGMLLLSSSFSWAEGTFSERNGHTATSTRSRDLVMNNNAQQERRSVSGRVTDETGATVIGVTVVAKGTTVGAITDIDGNFSFSIPNHSTALIFSFVGMKTIEVALTASNQYNVVMSESSIGLDEVIAVAYGAQTKMTVTGAISSVTGDDLLKTPTGSLTNALSGMVTGLSSVQYSGEPGADAANIYIRGVATLNDYSPLIQVDGVERDFSQLDPNEIESITVLKDASATAVFGVRGANGVILITTKRGKEGKAKISFSTSAGVQTPTRLLEFANSLQYATYYNEAQANDGATPDKYKFQPDVMEAFRTHSDPILYPDTDWLDLLLKDGALQTQHNINISGGTDRLRYFVSVGAFTQEGLFKTFDSGYDFNFNFNRYNYRANIDMDLTSSTLLSLNLGGRIEDKNTPISNEDQNQLFRHLYWATPFSGAGIVDGKWIKTNKEDISEPGDDGLSPYYGKGYNSKTTNVLNLDLILQQKLDFVTKGLTFKVKGTYNSSYNHIKTRSSSIPYYTPVKTATGEIEYMKSGDDSQLGYGENFSAGRNWYAEASLNYNRKFGNHNFGALALYNQSKTYYPKKFTDIPSGYVGMVGRVTYDWQTRYMAELNIGYNGSENFAPERRYGFLPAGSVGWVVSEEAFMSSIKEAINYLKLRASYGVVGNDKYYDERFMYLPDKYELAGDGYNFGTNVGSNKPGAKESTKSNPFVSWETAFKQNYGVDLAFFQERLRVSADVFYEHRKDILVQSETTPGILGATLPVVNLGVVDNHGYELSFKWNDEINKDFKYWVNANMSFARNKIIEKAEVKPNEDYMWQTGRPIGSHIIRKFWGFYDETANERYKAEYDQDIAEHAGGLLPGDVVYVDLNKDGVIDSDDVTKLGFTDVPEYVAGFSLGFSYKKFDLSAQFSGGFNASRLLEETFREPMGDTYTKGLLLYQYDQRWTPETASTATLPRATLSHRANNYKSSDLFLVNTNYVRLKNLEVGYNLDSQRLKDFGVSSLRIYANGYNLFTFSDFKLGDPESRTSSRPSYPLTRVYNVGLKVAF